MANPEGNIAYDIGGFFRVRHIDVPGRSTPYEFVDRIGAVTILPVLTTDAGESSVLTISNKRAHYGTIFETPGGNIDGGFDSPEDPWETALRELQEEIGYRPARPNDLELFRMRDVSRSVIYPRYLAVVRNLIHVGGTANNPSEVITIAPTPLDVYLDGMLSLNRDEAFPEVVLALTKAAQAKGRQAVRNWLITGAKQTDITACFSPWLHPVICDNPTS